ncbi:MAG: hypothetical protein RMI91_08350 [Gemmatales bacterium]|nr:hypothetical protein [Gemmatales bacterium]MDW7994652.1 hypothetical protein [Gemmatales bacterium]
MAIYGVQVFSWLFGAGLALLGGFAVWHSWRQGQQARLRPGLTRRELRYWRWRSGLRIAAGVILILSGGLLGYLGGEPFQHLEHLLTELTNDPQRAATLRTPENQVQLQRTLLWVMLLGLCALLLITVALAEITLTWLFGWHQRWELHKTQQAYLAQHSAEARARRQASSQLTPPTVS